MTRLGVVTGLAAEADCIHRAAAGLEINDRPLVFCAGGSAERARLGAERLVAAGAGALLSYGIAGALAPDLEPGALVLADAIITPQGRRIATDPGWRERLRERAEALCPMTVAALVGQDRAVATAEDKRTLFGLTKAVAVDMESHGVAAAAQALRLPLLALRAVADPAGRAVPSSALSGLAPDGRLRALPVIERLLTRPWEIVPLVRTAWDSRAAIESLSRAARLDPGVFALV